jgi:hypothetical protein
MEKGAQGGRSAVAKAKTEPDPYAED